MALPVRNLWANRYAQPSVGAGVWGTGINPVHYEYGSPHLRLNPIRPMEGMEPGEGPGSNDHTPPYEAASQPEVNTWGYTNDEVNYYLLTSSGMDWANRPDWTVPTPDSPMRFSAGKQPPWNANGAFNNAFRSAYGGARRLWRGKVPRATFTTPTETVSEGWLNKINAGPIAKAKPSDPSQYERQTSMQQRFAVRVNDAGVLRGTVVPTSPIASRVQPQRSPVYSQGQRLYDMYPVQQTADREREFYYRTAGTGPQDWLENNETYDIEPIEREVPANPYIGPPSDEPQADYGYTDEENFYA